ncbi:MAG: DUF393 domain-containing protein [Planctomycetaceae bacterium]|nr:DUF393 domain-containing protein [Planctomycetaceae bacterium]
MSQGNDRSVAFEVFFDGECPLCRREIEWLQRKDRGGKIKFIDIADSKFDAQKYGKTWEDFMSQMHGRFPDGTWVIGLDTFAVLYRTLNMGWLVAWTRWTWMRPFSDWGYRVFARNRLKWFGRKTGSCRVDGNCEVKLK